MVSAVSSPGGVTARALADDTACRHCRLPLPAGTKGAFCCRGCEEVFALLEGAGLTRYYELGGGEGHPVVQQASTDRKWLEPIAARLASQAGLTRIVLDVQGVHCAACVWLQEEIFKRQKGAAGIVVKYVMLMSSGCRRSE